MGVRVYIYIYVYLSDSPFHARHNLANTRTFASTLDILVSKIRVIYIVTSRATYSTVVDTTFRITLYAAGELTRMLKNLPYASSL